MCMYVYMCIYIYIYIYWAILPPETIYVVSSYGVARVQKLTKYRRYFVNNNNTYDTS